MTARKITHIFVHCSDSPDSMDIGAKEITEWHKQRGFDTIGYHAVARRNGTIEVGRPEDQAGAHAKGHNANSLAVCIVGRDQFTSAQLFAAIALIRGWMRKYNIPAQNVLGHREVDSGKTCPNIPNLDLLRKAVANH